MAAGGYQELCLFLQAQESGIAAVVDDDGDGGVGVTSDVFGRTSMNVFLVPESPPDHCPYPDGVSNRNVASRAREDRVMTVMRLAQQTAWI
jgi:hypothetical protein